MRLRGALRTMRKTVRRRFTQRGIILMYHRVASGVADPWRLCVSPKNFAEHMDALRRCYEPVPLNQLARRRGVRNRMVAVTFDDGYADNLHAALPILQHNEIPATFFLTSGILRATCEFWWDELERLLLRPQSLPRTLQLTAGTETRLFETGGIVGPGESLQRQTQSPQPWEAGPDTRLGFYYAVWQWLGTLAEEPRQTALAQIRDQLRESQVTRESHRSLTPDEVTRLAGAPQIDIGAHSVTHPMLSAQSPDAQRWEMHQSKQDLEALIGRPVAGFAYPHGDYGTETLDLARESGFDFACTVEGGCVARNTQPYLLPRLSIGDCSGAELLHLLEGAL
ncbi:MAG: polysaccharide deacetylase family protein [Steroidobacteraceae bacterium]